MTSASPTKPPGNSGGPRYKQGMRALTSGVTVIGAYGPDGVQIATVNTDANGYYGFTDLPAGRTEVRVGNQSWTESLALGVTRFPNLLLRTLTRAGN